MKKWKTESIIDIRYSSNEEEKNKRINSIDLELLEINNSIIRKIEKEIKNNHKDKSKIYYEPYPGSYGNIYKEISRHETLDKIVEREPNYELTLANTYYELRKLSSLLMDGYELSISKIPNPSNTIERDSDFKHDVFDNKTKNKIFEITNITKKIIKNKRGEIITIFSKYFEKILYSDEFDIEEVKSSVRIDGNVILNEKMSFDKSNIETINNMINREYDKMNEFIEDKIENVTVGIDDIKPLKNGTESINIVYIEGEIRKTKRVNLGAYKLIEDPKRNEAIVDIHIMRNSDNEMVRISNVVVKKAYSTIKLRKESKEYYE